MARIYTATGWTATNDLHSALLATKVWSTGSSAYVWPGDGTAPNPDSFTNIVFVDPTATHDPTTSTGGRNVTNDIWETGTTPAGVPAGGTVNQVLTKDSGTDYDTSWATPAAAAASLGSIIAMTRYCPNTYTATSTSSSTFADVDATNLAVTFTVPSSGKVLVELSALAFITEAHKIQWNLRESSSNVTGTTVTMDYPTGTGGSVTFHASSKHYVSGLTPAASKTYKWGHARLSGSTGVSTVYGLNGGDLLEGTAAFMIVWSVP